MIKCGCRGVREWWTMTKCICVVYNLSFSTIGCFVVCICVYVYVCVLCFIVYNDTCVLCTCVYWYVGMWVCGYMGIYVYMYICISIIINVIV